jgi:hypothetical protein
LPETADTLKDPEIAETTDVIVHIFRIRKKKTLFPIKLVQPLSPKKKLMIDREIATMAGETSAHVKETTDVLLREEDNTETKDVNVIDSYEKFLFTPKQYSSILTF